jgi:hypothetical protein
VNLFLKIIGVFIIFHFGVSCSFISTYAENNNYYIEYSSGGGMTGIVSGMTIGSNRSVKYWERKLNALPIITDSTEVTSAQLKALNKLMKNKEVFIYKNDIKGNYTARLTFVNNKSNNSFSFNPSELPKDMPEVIINIIAEIKNISNHK